MNSVTINLHNCHNNHVFLHNFALPNFGEFWFFCLFVFFFGFFLVEKVVNFGLNLLKYYKCSWGMRGKGRGSSFHE